jgi:hypothetical protein
MHWAAVGLIGLMVIVLLTAFNGVVEEHQLGHAFEEALPFTALLVVFFAIVAVIHDQHLFTPVIDAVLAMDRRSARPMFFLANGVLSMISDNVFVATVYINEVKAALDAGTITRAEFDQLAVAINTGTNLPSVATPNGQAAFLFLLTSALAPLIRLSYGRMVIMALPYTLVLGGVGLAAVVAVYLSPGPGASVPPSGVRRLGRRPPPQGLTPLPAMRRAAPRAPRVPRRWLRSRSSGGRLAAMRRTARCIPPRAVVRSSSPRECGLPAGHGQVDVGKDLRVEQGAVQLAAGVVDTVALAQGIEVVALSRVPARHDQRIGHRAALRQGSTLPFQALRVRCRGNPGRRARCG